MEIDEADGIYASKITDANEFFIKGLKDKKNGIKLEQTYKKKLISAREDYDKLIRKILKSKRHLKKNKGEDNPQDKEEIKKYKRKRLLNIRVKLSVFYFRLKIFLNNFTKKMVPASFIYFIKKSRSKYKVYTKRSKEYLIDKKNDFLSYLKSRFEEINKRFIKLLEKTKSKYVKINTILKAKFAKKKEVKTDSETKKEETPLKDDESTKVK